MSKLRVLNPLRVAMASQKIYDVNDVFKEFDVVNLMALMAQWSLLLICLLIKQTYLTMSRLREASS